MTWRTTDGLTVVAWVPTVASISAPTVANLTAGTVVRLEDYITSDGFDQGFDEAVINDSVLSTTQDFEAPGRAKPTFTLTCKKDDTSATDKAWETLVRNAVGYLVVRDNIATTTAFAAAQKVEVYEVTVGQRHMLAREANTRLKFQVRLYSSGPWTDAATVAA